jgi:hypothetical protein
MKIYHLFINYISYSDMNLNKVGGHIIIEFGTVAEFEL